MFQNAALTYFYQYLFAEIKKNSSCTFWGLNEKPHLIYLGFALTQNLCGVSLQYSSSCLHLLKLGLKWENILVVFL